MDKKALRIATYFFTAAMIGGVGAAGVLFINRDKEDETETSEVATIERATYASQVITNPINATTESTTTTVENVTTTEEETTVPESVVVRIYDQSGDYTGKQTGWFADVVKDKFGMEIEFVDAGAGIAAAMEAGEDISEFADIVIFSDPDNNEAFNTYAKNGTFLPLAGDEVELWAFYGQTSKYGSVDPADLTTGWYLRWDLFNTLENKDLSNLDAYNYALAQMRPEENTYVLSLYNDESNSYLGGIDDYLMTEFGVEVNGFGIYNPETDEYLNMFASGSLYREALIDLWSLNVNGLLDPESSTQTYEQALEKLKNGTVISTLSSKMAADYNASVEESMMLPVTVGETKNLIRGINTDTRETGWSIVASSEYALKSEEFLSWLMTDEGAMTCFYGPKDVFWYVDEDYNHYLTENGLAAVTDKSVSMEDYGYEGTFADGFFRTSGTLVNIYSHTANEKEAYGYTTWKSYALSNGSASTDWTEFTGALSEYDLFTNVQDNVLLDYDRSVEIPVDDEESYKRLESVIADYSWKCIFSADAAEFEQNWRSLNGASGSCGYSRYYNYCLEFYEESEEETDPGDTTEPEETVEGDETSESEEGETTVDEKAQTEEDITSEEQISAE